MTLSAKQSTGWFAALAAAVYTAVFVVSRSPAAVAHPGPIGIAALCDLAVTVPFLYYLLVVRQGRSSWFAIVAVLFAGVRAAAVLLPAAQQTYIPGLRWLGVPFEIWVLALIFRRLRRMDRGSNAVERIRAAVGAVIRNPWLAAVVAAEIEVFYYALFAWRAQPKAPPRCKAFTCGESSGYFTLAIFLALAMVFEGVPVHVLLHRWSPLAAWVATGLDVYALLWVIALMQSIRLNPILIGDDSLLLQVGLAWRIEVRRQNIQACRAITGATPQRKERGYLPLVVMNPPQWLIELREPATAIGLYGRRRTVTRIGIAVDDAEGFAAAIAGRL